MLRIGKALVDSGAVESDLHLQITESYVMITVVTLAVAVPSLLAVTFLGLQRIQSMPFARSLAHARAADTRGIALQTIIIMVVLLAIAGAVAAVLLTRAGEETARLEDQDLTDTAYAITSETLCTTSGYTWTADVTDPPNGVADEADDEADQALARVGIDVANAKGFCEP